MSTQPIQLDTFPPRTPSSTPGTSPYPSPSLPGESPSISPKASSSYLNATHELAGVSLPPVDRGRGAWTFVGAAYLLEMLIWGYSFTFGIIQVYLTTHAPFSGSSIAAIGSIGTTALALQYILPAGIILIFRRYPDRARAFLWTAVGVSCTSMFVSSWATEVWHLILLQGVLGGVSGAVLYTPVLIWLQDWFVERRGMASGIIFAGTGVGGFAFPFLIGGLLDKVGFAWTIRIWALFTLVTFSFAIHMLRPRLPVIKPTRGEVRGPFAPVDLGFLSNPIVLTMCATTFVSSLSFFPVSLDIPLYTVALASPLSANMVLAVYNAASVFGQVAVGVFSDRMGYPSIITIIGLVCSVTAFFSWGYADTLGKVFGFVILFGAFSGICSVWSAVARDVAGTNSQTSSLIFCSFGICRGIASILGPIIASVLYNPGASQDTNWGRFGFRGITIFVGTLALISAFGGVGLGMLKNRTKTL